MSALAIRGMLQAELRLRLRRTGTLVTLLALVALTWAMVPDPASGQAMISVDGARARYTSTCLALCSALLAALAFGLAGFYLLRGRMGEDLRSGVGMALAATPVGNGVFLLGRWLASVAYLCVLVLVFQLAMLAMHVLRGEGPIEPAIYLQTYGLVLLPVILFSASMALLFDAWGPLTGKAGDVLYMLLFLAQMGAVLAVITRPGQWSPALLVDFAGSGSVVKLLQMALHTNEVSIGSAPFDPALAPLVLPAVPWDAAMAGSRIGCALLAMLPLLPALALFHRYEPQKVRIAARADGVARWSPLALLNRALRPLSRAAAPLYALAARLPGVPGEAVAVLALALSANPAAVAAVLVLQLCGWSVDGAALPGVLIAATAIWGILVSEFSVRDLRYGVDAIAAAAPGGGLRRYGAQWLAALLLGALLTAPVGLRWLAQAPLLAAALASGLCMLAAAAALLGRASRGSRTFLALFLFGLYVATQTRGVPALDVVGFNGAATAASVLWQAAAAVLLGALGCGLAGRTQGGRF
jgi:hypothetical protein